MEEFELKSEQPAKEIGKKVMYFFVRGWRLTVVGPVGLHLTVGDPEDLVAVLPTRHATSLLRGHRGPSSEICKSWRNSFGQLTPEMTFFEVATP
jgi:hypothetical protein